MPIGLVDALELHEVKHCAKALGFLRCKRPWHFKDNATREGLIFKSNAVKTEKSDKLGSARHVAFTKPVW